MFEEDYNVTVLVIVLLISLFSHGIRASDVGGDCSEEQLEVILNQEEILVCGTPKVILNNCKQGFCSGLHNYSTK